MAASALFRRDILSAQPAKLYRAKMAELRLPFLQSVMVNTPDLVRWCCKSGRPIFPNRAACAKGLRPLLGNSVFVTNGATWARQRRMIDPAFEGGRLRDTFPAMWDAAESMAARLTPAEAEVEGDHQPRRRRCHLSHAVFRADRGCDGGRGLPKFSRPSARRPDPEPCRDRALAALAAAPDAARAPV